MKALMTTQFLPDYVVRLSEYMDIRQVGFATGGNLLNEDELVCELAGADVFIVGYDVVTRSVLQQSPYLKLIASIRGGPEANIDIEAATAAGIPVLHTIGRTDHAASEYVLAFMLAMARPLHKADRQMRDGTLMDMGARQENGASGKNDLSTAERDVVWPLEPDTPAYKAHQKLFGTELFDKTLGIVGFGNIGRAVARLALGFGMHILVHDPYVDARQVAHLGVETVDLLTLMSNADYVTLHARLTPGSVGIVGRRELKAMKPSACLINTARAALIDEKALVEALTEGWIRAAGLDVHHEEPLSLHHPTLSMDPDRVILSPHLAGSTREVKTYHSRLLTATLIRYLNGERPTAVANPTVFEEPSFAKRGGLLFGSGKRGQ